MNGRVGLGKGSEPGIFFRGPFCCCCFRARQLLLSPPAQRRHTAPSEQLGRRKDRWQLPKASCGFVSFALRPQLALPRLNGTDGAVHLQSDRWRFHSGSKQLAQHIVVGKRPRAASWTWARHLPFALGLVFVFGITVAEASRASRSAFSRSRFLENAFCAISCSVIAFSAST
jgi:hypothetical protein